MPSGATASVTGRFLAHNSLPAPRRALIADDLRQGRLRLQSPTLKQTADLTRVSIPYIQAAAVIADNPHLRHDVEAGTAALFDVARLVRPPRAPSPPVLKAAWMAANHEPRLEFAREHLAAVWAAIDTVTA
jgi:hypothetical protein